MSELARARAQAEATAYPEPPPKRPNALTDLLKEVEAIDTGNGWTVATRQRCVVAFANAVKAKPPTPIEVVTTLTRILRPQAVASGSAGAAFFALNEAQAWLDVGRTDLAILTLTDYAERCPTEAFARSERELFFAELLRGVGRFADGLDVLATLEGQLQTSPPGVPPGTGARIARTRAEIFKDTGQLEQAFDANAQALVLAAQAKDAQASAQALEVERDLLLLTNRAPEVVAYVNGRLAQLDPNDTDTRAELLVTRGYAESSIARSDPAMLPVATATLRSTAEFAQGSLRIRLHLKLADLALRSRDLDAAADWIGRCAADLGRRSDAELAETPDACELVNLQTRLQLAGTPRDAAALELAGQRQLQATRWTIGDWAKMPPTRSGIGFLHSTTRREILDTAVAVILATAKETAAGAEAAAQLLLDVQGQASLARGRGAPACRVGEVRAKLLGRASGAIVFLPASGRTLVFAIDSKGTDITEVAADLSVHADVHNLLRCAAGPPSGDAEALSLRSAAIASAGRRVADLILTTPLRARLRTWSAVTVVGTDLLGDLPLELLPLDDDHLLGEVIAIDHTPSLPLNVFLRRQRTAGAPGKPRILACTAPAAAIATAHKLTSFALPRDVLGELPAGTTLDDSATLAKLLALGWTDHDVTHVIAHGVRDSKHGAGLALRDGALWQADVATRRCAGWLMLSVCGAGRGQARPGEGLGMSSIAGAFLWQGASAVMVSRNDLVAEDHLRFAGDVHRALAKGASLARAVMLARAAGAGRPLWARAQFALVQVLGDGQAGR